MLLVGQENPRSTPMSIAACFRSPLALRVVAALALSVLWAVAAAGIARAAEPLGSTLETTSATVEPDADDLVADLVVETVAPVVETVAPVAETIDTLVAPVAETVAPISEEDGAGAGTPAGDSAVTRSDLRIVGPTAPRLMDLVSSTAVDPERHAAAARELVKEVAIALNSVPAPISFAEPASVTTPAVIQPATSVGSLFGGGAASSGSGGSDSVPLGLLGSVMVFAFLWRALISSPFTPPASVFRLVPVPPG